MGEDVLAVATDLIVMTLAGFGFGALWYGKFGERWMQAVGRTKEEISADKSPLPFVIGFVASLLGAIVLRVLFWRLGMVGMIQGSVLGAGLGFLLVAPWIVLNYAFAGRPRDLWWIDGLHAALAVTIMGCALGFLS